MVLDPEFGHDVVDGFGVGVFRKPLHSCQASVLDIHLIFYSSKHTLVMHEDFLGETLEDPLVLERLQRGHTIYRVPVEAQVDEIEEFQVLALLKHVLERLCVRQSTSPATIGHYNGRASVLLEEEVAATT